MISAFILALGLSFPAAAAKTFVYCSEGSPSTFNPQLASDGIDRAREPDQRVVALLDRRAAALHELAPERRVDELRRHHRLGRCFRGRHAVERGVLMAQGKTDWEIGTILGLSEETVTKYLKSARVRFGVARRTQLAIAAVCHGYIGLDEIVSWQ